MEHCTFAVITPDAYQRREPLLAYARRAGGFAVLARSTATLAAEQAEQLFAAHRERADFADLVAQVTSGPSELLVLRRPPKPAEAAVSDASAPGVAVERRAVAFQAWRDFCGPSDPSEARTEAPNSLRALFGTDALRNAVVGSASAEDVKREVAIAFGGEAAADKIESRASSIASDVASGGAAAKEYLSSTVVKQVTAGLSALCRAQPDNPLEWLARYLTEADAERTHTHLPPKIAFVLGGPGAGKGTQCARLVSEFGLLHVSAGDLLRAEVKSQSEQGKMIDEMIRQGLIVPGHITLDLLRKALQKAGSEQRKPGVLIDGFPRAVEQAIDFECLLRQADFCLFFDCPEEEMERRLVERGATSGRTDDNAESIRKRFDTFRETSMPVIDVLERRGKVFRVDASRPVEQVYEQVRQYFL